MAKFRKKEIIGFTLFDRATGKEVICFGEISHPLRPNNYYSFDVLYFNRSTEDVRNYINKRWGDLDAWLN